jgi:hypothetical protein
MFILLQKYPLTSISSELIAAAKLVRLPELLARPKHLTVGKFLQQRCKDVVDVIFGPTTRTGKGYFCKACLLLAHADAK